MERGEDADAVLLDMPLAQLRGSAGLLDKHISDLVKMRRRIQASEPPNKRELVKEVNAEIEASMHRLNQATAEVLGQVRRRLQLAAPSPAKTKPPRYSEGCRVGFLRFHIEETIARTCNA